MPVKTMDKVPDQWLRNAMIKGPRQTTPTSGTTAKRKAGKASHMQGTASKRKWDKAPRRHANCRRGKGVGSAQGLNARWGHPDTPPNQVMKGNGQ